jgi:hypothetical protein
MLLRPGLALTEVIIFALRRMSASETRFLIMASLFAKVGEGLAAIEIKYKGSCVHSTFIHVIPCIIPESNKLVQSNHSGHA